MQKITINELRHDGMRYLKCVGDAPLSSAALLKMIPAVARGRAEITRGVDDAPGVHWTAAAYPVFEPYEFFIYGPKNFRRLMVVHFAYAERISACIKLARTEFNARAAFSPRDAYVRELPAGAEHGMAVHGCILHEAEWMPAGCAAVGGFGG